MGSEANPADVEEHSALHRFRSSADYARSLLPSVAEGIYSDVFTQRLARNIVEGRATVRQERVLPLQVKSYRRISEGVAFRRLGPNASFAASDGITDDVITSLARHFDRRDTFQLTVTPSSVQTQPVPAGSIMESYIQDVADALLSFVTGCRRVDIRCSNLCAWKALANSEGHQSMTEQSRTELHVEIDLDGKKLAGTWVDWDSEDPPSTTPRDIALEFEARARREAVLIDRIPERSPVLLPPGWGGTWMHEAVGHVLEADSALSTRGPLRDLRGRQVSEPVVNIVDDGSLSPSRVTGSFDDEGVPTGTTSLIEQGVVVGLLTDRLTADEHGLPKTGNGRRPHFGLPPRPRMTNLLMRSGTVSRQELVKAADSLIIADRIERAWLDSAANVLYLSIVEGKLVRHAETIGVTGPFLASGEPLEILREIRGVGTDFAIDLDNGYCMKDGAAVPVTIGQPTVLIGRMNIERMRPV